MCEMSFCLLCKTASFLFLGQWNLTQNMESNKMSHYIHRLPQIVTFYPEDSDRIKNVQVNSKQQNLKPQPEALPQTLNLKP